MFGFPVSPYLRHGLTGCLCLLNAIGYLVAYVAIRRGYSKDVLTCRGVTIALIIGIAIGFVPGQLI